MPLAGTCNSSMNELVKYITPTEEGDLKFTTDPSQPRVARTPTQMLVKVPESFYQELFLLAQNSNKKVATLQIRKQLSDWVAGNFPGYGILNMVDLTRYEADIMAEKTGQDITWGMYLLMDIGETSFVNDNQLE